MPTAEQAILYYEADQTPVAMVELTDQGDHMDFKSAATLWSGKSGRAPVVRPDGLKSGGVIIPAVSASNDVVDISEAKVFLAGVETTVSASTDEAIVRPSVSNYQKFSITVTALGAFAVVDGAEHTSFSTVRGADGGPPFIDNDAVEIGQVWWDSQTPAAVGADEIYQVDGQSLERWDSPLWEVEYIDVSNNVLGLAGINFHSALPLIHSEDAGSTTYGKDVYASYYTPVFVEVVDAFDFVPPVNSHTINSQAVYGRVKGSKSSTINAGSFSAELNDGISDNLLKFVDYLLWFKFKQDRLSDPYILCQGYLGAGPQFPAAANVSGAFTIAAQTVGDNVTS